MTIYKSVRVDCDQCSKFGDEAGSLQEVRRSLRRQGWYMKGGQDLCPNCRPDRNTKEKNK